MAQSVRAHKHGHRHKGSEGVTIKPWVDTWGHSAAMGRHRGSQYSHGKTKGVTVQPLEDTRGHSTAMSRQRDHSTAMGRH